MRDDYIEWERFSHPYPDEEDSPTPDEIQTLREFVEHYSTFSMPFKQMRLLAS